MRKMRWLLTLAIVFFACSAWADPTPLPDASPLDRGQVLRELDSLAEVREQQAKASLSARREALAAAAEGGSKAAVAYEKAVAALHTGSNADFADWSRDKADLLRSEAMQKAIALHARYLLLGLDMRQAAASPASSAEAAPSRFIAYAKELGAFQDEQKGFAATPKEAKELLDKPVREEVFFRWLGLGDYLPEKDRWEEKAGNLEGILEKNVRAPLRAAKSSKVLAAWDTQIEWLQARASRTSEAEALRTKQTDIPRAIYGRALDKRQLGMRNAFLRDALSLAKQHPGHPDWDEWVRSIRSELETDEPVVPGKKGSGAAAAER